MSEPPATPESPGTPPAPEDTLGRQRAAALAEVVLCSGGPTQIAIATVLRSAGWSAEDATGKLSLPFVLTLSLADTAALIVLMILLLRARDEEPAALWLGQRRPGREVLRGLLTAPLLMVGAGLLLNTIRLFIPWLHNVETNPFEQLATSPGDVAMLALLAIVAGGLREELQRAFILHRFEQHLGGTTVGVMVVSIAFGLGHYVQGWDAAIATGALGWDWAVMYVKRRSSVGPIASHGAFNAMELIRAALVTPPS